MNYKALISTIIFLGLIGIIFALLQERSVLQEQIEEGARMEEKEPINEEELGPTELTEENDSTFYRGEELERKTYRCEYGGCLFAGGGGLVGLTTLEGYITAIERETMDGDPAICDAFYVKRGPSELLEDDKIGRFFNEETGALLIPFTNERTASEGVWVDVQDSSEDEPVNATVFFEDAAELGTGPCYSAMHIVGIE